jgi:hypothetical protein
LRGKRYETEKKIVSNELGNNQYKKEVGDHCDHQPICANPRLKTREKIAKEYGVGDGTIQRDAQFARAVDILPAETKQKIISGDLPVSILSIHVEYCFGHGYFNVRESRNYFGWYMISTLNFKLSPEPKKRVF